MSVTVASPGGPSTGREADLRADPAHRRRLLLETALLLGLSLGQSGVYSVLRIIERMTRPEPLAQQTTTMNASATPDRPWLDLAYQLTHVVFLMVPALMALFLLRTVLPPRGGGWRAAGLDGSRWLGDIGWGWLVAAAIGIPGLFFYLGARALGVNTTVSPANLAENWWTIPVYVLAAFGNGLLEEVVMVGYLFVRWRQAGWGWPVIVLVSAVIRGSYHLYQGWGGFAGNVIMGVLFGLFWLRTRRTWSLVVAHGFIDVAAFVGYALLAGRASWL